MTRATAKPSWPFIPTVWIAVALTRFSRAIITTLPGPLVRQFLLVPARHAHLLRAVAAAALTIGYADLIRGGITIGPVLVVIAYAVLVPAVILTWR